MTEHDIQPDNGDQADQAWPEIHFNELSDKLKEACARAGWESLMPVQARSMAAVMHRQDIMVQARTGSGKTGAFVLPLIDRIDPGKNHCQALVLLPTRELAKQVADEAATLSGGTIRTVPVYGGVGYGPQMDAFKKGAHLVVGTPGRILDHLMRGSLNIDHLDTLIFDEADRMLSIGFYPDMKQLQSYLPERDIHGLMFSATFPPMVLRLSEEFLNSPQFISLSEDHVHVAEVSHAFYQVPAMGKERALAKLIEVENPSSAIIFTNTKANCNFVAAVLSQFGYNADALSSDLSQAKREKVLGRVRQGKLRFLVATDVAARGIDIPELSHVFLYEPPEDRESYIHRAGRTGRAGAAGEVISLVDLMQKMELKRIGSHYKIPLIERELPEDKDVRSIVGQRTTALLEARYRKTESDIKQGFKAFWRLVDELASRDDAIGHLAMLLDEFYHAQVHGQGVPPLPSAPAEASQAAADDAEVGQVEPGLAGLATALDKAYSDMKPLSRERMMKFMPLARELSQDDDGKDVLAMLLGEYAFHAAPVKPGKRTPAKKPPKDTAPRQEKTSRRERAPKPDKAPKPKPEAREAEPAEAEAAAEAAPQATPEAAPEMAKGRTQARNAESNDGKETMDVLARLRSMQPLTQGRMEQLLPLAEELIRADGGLESVAFMLDRFERESRRIDARKAKRSGGRGHGQNGQNRPSGSGRSERTRPDRNKGGERTKDRAPRGQAPKEEEPQEQTPAKPGPVPEGPVHAFQEDLWDDTPDQPEEPVKRKKRPRRRRRKKSSS